MIRTTNYPMHIIPCKTSTGGVREIRNPCAGLYCAKCGRKPILLGYRQPRTVSCQLISSRCELRYGSRMIPLTWFQESAPNLARERSLSAVQRRGTHYRPITSDKSSAFDRYEAIINTLQYFNVVFNHI